MFAIEEHPSGWAPDLVIEGHTEQQIGHHVHLMIQAGLVEGVDDTTGDSDGPSAMATSLTWSGHEFAAAARNDTVWNKAKVLVKDKVGGIGFGLLAEVLKQQAKHAVGLV